MLEEEVQEIEREKIRHMVENCPPLSIPGCMQELQVNFTIIIVDAGWRSETQMMCSPSSFISHVSFCQELCRKIHKQIDLVDEERYDMDIKVKKSDKEVRLFKLYFLPKVSS